ncbi:MAG: S8 family serine peptidase [Clostridiales bacterium]|nr:S8 family serine peptidase [Clostridiales bacterium]
MKNRRKLQKALSFLLTAALVATMAPAVAFMAANSDNAAKGTEDAFGLMYDSDVAAMAKVRAIVETSVRGAKKEQLMAEIEGVLVKGGTSKGVELAMPGEARRRVELAVEQSREDRFIVAYKEGAGDIRGLAGEHGIAQSNRIDGRTEVWVMCEKTNPAELAAALRANGADSQIRYVQPDFSMVPFSEEAGSGASAQEELLLGLEVNDESSGALQDGNEVVVALLDSKIDTSHDGLAGCFAPGWDFTMNSSDVFSDGAEARHATSLAGVIKNASGGSAKIMPLVIFDTYGRARTSSIIEALAFAEANGASIANCSFGSSECNIALKEAMESSSLFISCAVGNSRQDLGEKPVFPACFRLGNLAGVASANADSSISYFSNYSGADIAARGRDVYSTLPGNSYGKTSGTSMAAAEVSGSAAAVLSLDGSLDAAALKSRLVRTGDKLAHLKNKVTDGRRLNLENALADIEQTEETTAEYADDFDAHGWQPSQEGRYGLFSGGAGPAGISAGNLHSLVAMDDQSVWSFGDNTFGELGDGSAAGAALPVQVVGISDAVAVSAGGSHSLALTAGGSVLAWGDNSFYQLGIGYDGGEAPVPNETPDLDGIVKISAGGLHNLALDSFGICWSWGDSEFGQAGQGRRGDPFRPWPQQMVEIAGIADIAAGAYHSLALSTEGVVYAWGRNDSGQLGDGTCDDTEYPVEVLGLPEIAAISAGGAHSAALDVNGGIWTWGGNSFCQLGADSLGTNAPIEVESLSGATGVSAGALHSIALTDGNLLYGWGCNEQKQAGEPGGYPTVAYPQMIGNFADAADMSAGGFHNLVLKADGSLWAFGDNSSGQLGDGSLTGSAEPVLVWGGGSPPSAGNSFAIGAVSGTEYVVAVRADSVNSFANMEITLSYDTSVFDFKSAKGLLSEAPVQGAPGEMTFTVGKAVPLGKAYSGAIGLVTLKAKKTANSTVQISN